MDRRQFLQGATTVIGSASLAGCSLLGGGGGSQPGSGVKELAVGQTTEQAGLKATVNSWQTTAGFVNWEEDNNGDIHPPKKIEDNPFRITPDTAGAQMVMLDLTVTNVSDEQLSLPLGNQMTFTYNEDEKPGFWPQTKKFTTLERSAYESYTVKGINKGVWERGVYPGVTLSGKVLFEAPQKLKKELASFTLSWAPTGEQYGARASWQLAGEQATPAPPAETPTPTPTPTSEPTPTQTNSTN